jgi:glucarate dehydratase
VSTIRTVRATAVNVPMVAPYRFAFGAVASFTSTLVEVEDSDGVVGIGESPHGDLVTIVDELGQRIAGLDITDLTECERRCVPQTGFSAWSDPTAARRAFGGIEIALWDLRARREGRPLVDLLGGRFRAQVGFTEYFALRAGREETPADVVRYCERMLAEHEAPWFEGKLGVLDPDTELAMVRDVAAAVAPSRLLRMDANGRYLVSTARRVVARLADLGVGWLEDPCRTLDETAMIGRGWPVAFSTHEPDFARAARAGVPDGFCLDVAELGGIRRTQDFLRACALLGIDFWFYSGDAGVMTAAYLHLTAAEPSLIRPHQALFRFTADVAVAEGHYRPRQGMLPVPSGPGLGVTLDASAVARLAERHRSEGPLPSGVQGVRTGDAFRRE